MIPLMYKLFNIVLTFSLVATENDYFPGLRRTKPSQGATSQWVYDGTPIFMKTINELIEERARQRFLEHWQRIQSHRNILPKNEIADPAFTYHITQFNAYQDQNNPIEFAVGPYDSRFYENSYMEANDENNSEQELFYSNPNINLPPSPQDIKPKLPIYVEQQSINYKLRTKESDEKNALHRVSGVVQQPIQIEGAVTLYVVALIGGISAAVTVGIISIVVGGYTLHKKAKAATDVEYPAYGVTGPNKESSPSSDKKLAQSAQMYHYQHQKQQIIAMENRNHCDNNTNHSEAESEDDNNEGDYTVYECPGLAPAGEMEVKNPLFLDDSSLGPGNGSK